MAAIKIDDSIKKQIINDDSGLSTSDLARKYKVSYGSVKRLIYPEEWHAKHEKRKERLKNNPEYKRRRWNEALKYLYGISVDDYQRMLDEQNGSCACCGRDETEEKNGVTRHFCVDHNHKTGQIRGLLCHRCNRMIGSALENIHTLRNAIVYLEHYGGLCSDNGQMENV